MKYFIKKGFSNPLKNVSVVFLSITCVLGITFFRKNKLVILHNIFEETNIKLTPELSSIDNLSATSGANYHNISLRKRSLNYLKYILSSYFSDRSNYISSKSLRQKLPNIKLNIAYKNLDIILKDRLKTIDKGFLDKPRSVRGNIVYLDSNKPAKFRLKGDLLDHWTAGKRFSLRTKINSKSSSNSDDYILGMNNFSLHKLKSRQYPYGFLFHDVIDDLGFHFIKHKIVNVDFNNTDWGLMDMQDTYGDSTFAYNQLRESLVFRFSNDVYWKIYKRTNDIKDTTSRNDYWLSHPRLFVDISGRTFKSLNENEYQKYFYVLNMLRRDDYQEILFNEKLLSEAQEVLAIWGEFHPIGTSNARFYLNPFTLKLEPFMTDQGYFVDLKNSKDSVYTKTHGFLEPIPLSLKEQNKIRLDTIKQLESKVPYLYSELYFPGDPAINLNIPRSNYEYLKINDRSEVGKLNVDNSSIYSKSLDCRDKNYNAHIKFQTLHATYNKSSLEVTPLICSKIILKSLNVCNKKFDLDQVLSFERVDITKPISIPIPIDFQDSKCRLNPSNLSYIQGGKENLTNLDFLPSLNKSANPLLANVIPSNLLNIKGDKNYFFKTGDLTISKPIIINGNLKISAETTLRFEPNSYLIVNGNLTIDGTPEKPVVMTSKSINKTWKGVYVYSNSDLKSQTKINNLHIQNTSNLNDGILNLTGGFTIYNSNVSINNMKILQSSAEDALNIVKSDVDIDKLFIQDVDSDAFDCDFCNGKIKNVNLLNIGGDGLDFSGSKIFSKINSASGVSDKVISVGEASQLDINLKNVKNSFVAVAVKDGSQANILLSEINVDGPIVMSYSKKPYFTDSSEVKINYYDNNLQDISNKFITTKDSNLFLNEKKIDPIKIDVDYLYKYGPMKK